MSSQNETKIPPINAKRVYRWADLPNMKEPALYLVTDPGQEAREIVVSNNQRRVLEGLMRGPIFAASYCRLSDQVLPLRRDHGVNIECEMHRNDAETGRERYGIYHLRSQVKRMDGEA